MTGITSDEAGGASGGTDASADPQSSTSAPASIAPECSTAQASATAAICPESGESSHKRLAPGVVFVGFATPEQMREYMRDRRKTLAELKAKAPVSAQKSQEPPQSTEGAMAMLMRALAAGLRAAVQVLAERNGKTSP